MKSTLCSFSSIIYLLCTGSNSIGLLTNPEQFDAKLLEMGAVILISNIN